MTDSSLSFLTAADPTDAAADDEPSASRARVLVMGGALVLALAAGGFAVLSGGEDDLVVAASGPAVTAPSSAAVPEAAASPSAAPPTPVPAAAPAGVARDPFRVPDAAAVRPAADPDPAPASAPAAAPVVGALPDPATGGGGLAPVPEDLVVVPLPGGTEGSVPLPVPVAPERWQLVLTGVSGTAEARTAVLSVDGVRATVAVGATFGASSDLRLVSIQEGPGDRQWTAVVQRGDAEPFDVVTGAPVTVT